MAKGKKNNTPPTPNQGDVPGLRLQKVLAAAGHGSRRACEELIVAGRVEVDGLVVEQLGTRVDPSRHVVRVDGVALPRQRYVYYLVNKPPGVVCTNRDPAGRTRVIDMVPGDQRLFTVGRLDMASEGLILVTNDGDLANRLAHPRYGVAKLYQVEVAGHIEPRQLKELRGGIHLAEAVVRVDYIRIKKKRPHSTLLEITLREGRNREIRRMLARVGHKVLNLRRVALGPLRLGEIPQGTYRELTSSELKALRKPARGKPKAGRRAGKKKLAGSGSAALPSAKKGHKKSATRNSRR